MGLKSETHYERRTVRKNDEPVEVGVSYHSILFSTWLLDL